MYRTIIIIIIIIIIIVIVLLLLLLLLPLLLLLLLLLIIIIIIIRLPAGNVESLRNNCSLVQPKCFSSTYGLNLFSYNGARLWNNLSNDFKRTSKVKTFKMLQLNGTGCHVNVLDVQCVFYRDSTSITTSLIVYSLSLTSR